MAQALSNELRTLIFSDRDRGILVREIAEKYNVTERTIYNLLRHRRETGTTEPIRGRQGRKSRLAERKLEIVEVVHANPKMTLRELKERLNLDISLPALWRTLRRWEVRVDKNSPTVPEAKDEQPSKPVDPPSLESALPPVSLAGSDNPIVTPLTEPVEFEIPKEQAGNQYSDSKEPERNEPHP